MKHALFTIAATIFMSAIATAQKPYAVSKDDQTGAQIFKGPITFADLNAEASFGWMKKGLTSYRPDTAAVRTLSRMLPAYTIVTMMGTWCDDSQNLVPKLAKVLSLSKFPMERYVMYGVDRAKETGGIERKLYSIVKVPTIIVYKDNMEVGRITESVQKSIEEDLVKIVGAK